MAIQCRELVSANAEVCRVLYDKITAEVSSGQHAQVKSQLAEWDRSHDAYLFALRLVGLPLVSLERPIVPPLQSMTIEPSEETITVKSVRDHIATFSEDSRQGLHQGAVLLRYYLALWPTGMGVSIAMAGGLMLTNFTSPAAIIFLVVVITWTVLRLLGSSRAAARLALWGYFCGEAIAMAGSCLRSIEALQGQLHSATRGGASCWVALSWAGAGLVVGDMYNLRLSPKLEWRYILSIFAIQSTRIYLCYWRTGDSHWLRAGVLIVFGFGLGLFTRRVTCVAKVSISDIADLLDHCLESNMSLESRSSKCIICLARAQTHAFVPCGHRCSCEECGEAWISKHSRTCPMCRTPSYGFMRVFDVHAESD